jgi:hypothetical protein
LIAGVDNLTTLEAISFRVKNGITVTTRPIPVVIIAERVTPDM